MLNQTKKKSVKRKKDVDLKAWENKRKIYLDKRLRIQGRKEINIEHG